jgi:hypothetical protein
VLAGHPEPQGGAGERPGQAGGEAQHGHEAEAA